MSIDVNFWGTRGSYPQCGEDYQEFGGHTSCVSLHADTNLFIIDGGSGLGKLSSFVEGKNIKKAHLFLSHLHMDHISGFPSFRPFWQEDFEAYIYCAKEISIEFGGVEAAFNSYFTPPYFPILWQDFPSQKQYYDFSVGDTLSPEADCEVKTMLMNHPGGASGYRFSLEGKSVVYLSDTNHTDGIFDRLIEFSREADLVIYDATFSEAEHQKFPHYGHSTWEKACELAIRSDCKNLALHHHDYGKTDGELREIERQAKILFPGAFAARCGQKIVI